MTAFYNEVDHFCCDWLQALMDAGEITPGKIDDRSIADLSPDDVRGYERCHFFAGIGGWDVALDLAGWGATRPVWTGSCPCQPFSIAAQGDGADDQRHLWPDWFRIVRAVRPATLFGEQVEGGVGWGWLDLVCSDMGTAGYTVRSAVLPACGVGAPHVRQRLWFVADAGHVRRPPRPVAPLVLADDGGARLEVGRVEPARDQCTPAERGGGVGDPWGGAAWVACKDGKARPIEPGTFPLADGVPARVGRLRAYGNAISPQVAAAFIRAASM